MGTRAAAVLRGHAGSARRGSPPDRLVTAGIAAVGLRRGRRPGGCSGRDPLPWNARLGSPRAAALRRRDGVGGDRAHVRRRSRTFGVGGGVAVFDCNGDGRPDLYLAGGGQPATLVAERQRDRRRAPVHADPGRGDGPGRRHRRLPARRRRRWDHRPRGAPGRRPRPAARPRRLPVRARRTRHWAVDGGQRLDDGVQRDLGGDRGPADARRRQLPAAGRHGPGDQYAATTTSWSDPGRMASGYAPPTALTPGLLRAVDAVQRLGPVGAARPAGQQRPPVLRLRATARSSCGASRRASRRGLYTADDGWVPMQLWGMGIASYDLTGDGYPEVFLTSQGANRLQTLTAGPSQPTYRDIGAQARRRTPRSRTPATPRCRRPPGTPSSRTSTTTASSTCSSPRATSARSPTTRCGTRATCLLGQPDGTFAEGAPERRASRSSSRGAVPHWPTSTSTACSTSSRSSWDTRRESGATSARARAASPAAMGHWVALRAQQPGPQPGRDRGLDRGPGRRRRRSAARSRSAAGTRVASLAGLHVGLGSATRADVRVTWPGRFGRAVARRVGRHVRRRASAGGRRRRAVDAAPMRTPTRAERSARLAEVSTARLRTAGDRDPRSRDRCTRSGWSVSARAPTSADYDRLLVLRRP